MKKKSNLYQNLWTGNLNLYNVENYIDNVCKNYDSAVIFTASTIKNLVVIILTTGRDSKW